MDESQLIQLRDENERLRKEVDALRSRAREWQATERRLAAVAEEWARTFDALPDLVSVVDRDFRFVHVNRALARRLGISAADAQGRLCHELMHGTDSPPAFCPHLRTLDDRRPHDAEFYEPRLEGIYLVTDIPLFAADGSLEGSLHIARDVSAALARPAASASFSGLETPA
jgi:PAS domain S-box-containing protein